MKTLVFYLSTTFPLSHSHSRSNTFPVSLFLCSSLTFRPYLYNTWCFLSPFLYLTFFLFSLLNLSLLFSINYARESSLKGKYISTVDLLLLTCSDQLLFIRKLYFSFSQNNVSLWGGQLYWAIPFRRVPWLFLHTLNVVRTSR